MTKPQEPETPASETPPTARAQVPTQPTAAGGAQNTEPTTVEEAGRTKSGIKLRHVLSALVSIGLVTLIFWKLLPQVASISDIWTSIRDMTWLEVTTLVLAALWNLCTYWFVMVGTMPA